MQFSSKSLPAINEKQQNDKILQVQIVMYLNMFERANII